MKKVIFFLAMFFVLAGVCASDLSPEAEAFFKKAEAAFVAKDLSSASSNLLEALKIEPDNAFFRYILGQVQVKQGNYLDAKSNLEIVSRSRPSPNKGEEYNSKLKSSKRKIKDLQSTFNQAGKEKFELYQKHKDSAQKLKLAVTLFQAFRLNPPLRYRNYKLLESIIGIYEAALKKSFEGTEWQKKPMLQLAFLYEIANKKDKAAEVYMRALDYVEDTNEEFVITHKFDYLNRSNKEKLLDTIEAGEFTRQDLEELIGSGSQKISEDDKKKIEDIISDARAKLEDATTDEERESVLEEIKATIIEKQKRGELPGQDELKKKLEKEGKTMEEYLKEKGL
jgi:tetratricopeptide (TPR) repeat protein